jgi:predicted cupin superfamily sugar epimerase
MAKYSSLKIWSFIGILSGMLELSQHREVGLYRVNVRDPTQENDGVKGGLYASKSVIKFRILGFYVHV